LLKGVLSTTPGNFLAEYTVKTSEKQAARTGALPVLMLAVCRPFVPLGGAGIEVGVVGAPTLTKENRKLWVISKSAMMYNYKRYEPKVTLSSDRQILKHEPDANTLISVCQAECTGSKTTDEITSEHALWLCLVVGRSGELLLLLDLLAGVLRWWWWVTGVTLCVNLSS
jgi:hypothetical protein